MRMIKIIRKLPKSISSEKTSHVVLCYIMYATIFILSYTLGNFSNFA